jgi:hypothetical protein
MTGSRAAAVAVVAGVIADILWLGLMEATARFIPAASPWQATVDSTLTSLGPMIPGFVAGLVAERRGFTVGATASLLSSILLSAYVSLISSPSFLDPRLPAAIPPAILYAVIAIVVGGICGVAGASVRRERRNAF